MAIETECPSCGRAYRVKDELDGRKIRCKDCGEPFVLRAAQQDDWDQDDWGDDGYADAPARSAQPATRPRRRKSGGKPKASAARKKKQSSGRPAWQLPVGLIGVVIGLGILGLGIHGFQEGHRKSVKAMIGGVVFALGSASWAFGLGGDDDE